MRSAALFKQPGTGHLTNHTDFSELMLKAICKLPEIRG